ncbi:MAG TPA: DUF721 domain-containing protein [Desulfonatronum sp.]|nr:DUF721 domain-containing protein [Desulfonatronum sp.]
MQRTNDILRGFWNKPEQQRELRLASLWSLWSEIIGPEIADLAKPLGHNKTTLLLGVEDAMVMQEITFQAPRILRTVNAALGEAYFDKVRFDLLGARSSLDAVAGSFSDRPAPAPSSIAKARQLSEELGGAWGHISGIPAVKRCYMAYVHFHGQSKTNYSLNRPAKPTKDQLPVGSSRRKK